VSAPAAFVRRPGLVQALHIRTPGDLWAAHVWLHQHDIRAARDGDLLKVYGLGATRVDLRVGQHLVHDVNLGDFQVLDHADFTALHDPIGATA
jgi:hypothetical protein